VNLLPINSAPLLSTPYKTYSDCIISGMYRHLYNSFALTVPLEVILWPKFRYDNRKSLNLLHQMRY